MRNKNRQGPVERGKESQILNGKKQGPVARNQEDQLQERPDEAILNRESILPRKLKIDRAVYLVEDRTKTYQYLQRNPEWERLSRKRNEANKKAIDGYTRIFRDGRTRTYQRSEHP